MEIMYIVALLLSMAVLIVACLKGVHPVLAGIAAALVAAIFSGMDVVSTMTNDYMAGFVGFLQSNFLIFFAGCAYGLVMKTTGASETVANWIIRVIGKKYAIFALPITIVLLMYGGVNGFVIIFTVWPIFVNVFKEANVSRTLMPCLYFIGAGSLANCGPGTPQGLNLVVTGAYGVDSAAAPVVGFIGGFAMFALQLFWFNRIMQKSRARGEVFNPEGIVDDVADELAARENRKLPPLILSILPLICCVGLLNIKVGGEVVFTPVVALWAAVVIAAVCNARYFEFKRSREYLTEACKQTVDIIIPSCGVMGFAAVIKIAPAFQMLVDIIPEIPFPPMLSLFLMTNVFCAITGTATGAASIVSSILGPIYTGLGLDPGLAARVQIMSATAFDTMPHNGTLVASIKMAHEDHKACYGYMFQCSVIIPAIGALVGIAAAYLLGMA